MMEEIFVPIKGYEGIYEISNLGRVKALESLLPHYKSGTMKRKEKFLKIYTHKQGYLFATLCMNYNKKNYFIHRLVAIAFIENPHNFKEVNHKDAIKANNNISNLEWCDRKHNHRHSIEMGLSINLRGEEHSNSKLTDKDVLKIRELYKSNNTSYRKEFSCDKIGKMFGVSKPVIAKIVKRKSWTHL